MLFRGGDGGVPLQPISTDYLTISMVLIAPESP